MRNFAVKPTTQSAGLVWWNTGLTPNAAKDRASDADRDSAVEVLRAVCAARPALLGFSEIGAQDVDAFQKGTALGRYIFSECGRVVTSRSSFDTCVAFDPAILSLLDQSDVIAPLGNSRLRVGQRFLFGMSGSTSPLHVVISHWPSKLHPSEESPNNMYGFVLRQLLDEIAKEDPDPQIVLMGDYNEEPYDECLSIYLRSTRDKARALYSPGLMYNPFWQHMSPSRAQVGRDSGGDHGTYYHSRGVLTRWHTFDQMMFSKSLLDGSRGWSLDEFRTRVFKDYGVDEIIQSSSVLDHMPIISRLVKVEV